MTAIQKTLIGAVLALAIGFAIYESLQGSKLRREVAVLQQQQTQHLALSNRVQELEREQARATNAQAATQVANTGAPKTPNEVLRLRGEVGMLRKENATIGSTNAVSKVTANPEGRKMLRDQQKMGMAAIYRGFAKAGSLSSEQADKLNELLADHIMDNVDNVTRVLRDKPSPDEMNNVFANQEAVLNEKVRSLIGDEGLTQFQEYTKGLLGKITADQFRPSMTGDESAKQDKAKALAQLIQEERQAALAAANLPADYEAIPMLNFRNIASEQEGEQSVKLLETIYTKVAARSSSFLSPEEVKQFQDFRDRGVQNNRAMLMMNRTMMAPISQ